MFSDTNKDQTEAAIVELNASEVENVSGGIFCLIGIVSAIFSGSSQNCGYGHPRPPQHGC